MLAGLLFSEGEGVQLLPFPVAENVAAENIASFLEENPKPYAFSVLNSNNPSPLVKSKFQKQVNQYLHGRYANFDRSDSGANLGRHSARNRPAADFSHISLVLGSQSDRAPPAIRTFLPRNR